MILHVTDGFSGNTESDRARYARARRTWGTFKMIPVRDGSRNARTELGDSRELLFVRDLIQGAVDVASNGDAIVLTNSDSCLVSDIDLVEVGWSHRWDMDKVVRTHLSYAEAAARGVEFAGIDLVCLTVGWWNQIGKYLPDVVMGCEGWDWIYRFAIGDAGKMPTVVYHEAHGFPYWYTHRLTSPANLYNRRLAKEWVEGRDDSARIKALWPGFKNYS